VNGYTATIAITVEVQVEADNEDEAWTKAEEEAMSEMENRLTALDYKGASVNLMDSTVDTVEES